MLQLSLLWDNKYENKHRFVVNLNLTTTVFDVVLIDQTSTDVRDLMHA